jgi:hypothetical protein
LRLLVALTLSKDLLQALLFNSDSGAGGLSHFLRDFKPVHGHDYRISHGGVFSN